MINSIAASGKGGFSTNSPECDDQKFRINENLSRSPFVIATLRFSYFEGP